MRIAIIADSHFDERARFSECVRVHDFIAEDIRAREVDLIIHTGDLFERASTPIERAAAFGWVQRCADLASFVIVRGNHDQVGDLLLAERLKAHYPIHAVESAEMLVMETRRGPVALGLLGWPQRSNIAKLFQITRREEAEQTAAEALRGVFRYLGSQFDALNDPSIPRIVAAHAMVRASRVSTGQPLVGCDFEIGLEDLALAYAHFYALGHVHLGQDWQLGSLPGAVGDNPQGPPIVYPGSPRRTNFGEIEPKGYVIAEFEGTDRRPRVTWHRVETPCTPMVLVEDEWGWSDEAGRDDWIAHLKGYEGPESVAGAEVKLRYRVSAAKKEAAALAAEVTKKLLLEDGAIDVLIEPELVVDQRMRAPEVANATTLEEKVQALWQFKGFDPGARREALMSKLARAQAET